MAGLLALDVGEKRIGVAVSEWSDLATPLGVVARGPDEIEAIRGHMAGRTIDRIIVGLPISLDDTIGTQAKRVLRFVERLRRAVDVPVETYDERFTTHEAEEMLLDANVSRARRRRAIDALAAVQILKGYLAARSEGKTADPDDRG